jgi:hypothetical protein
LRFLKLKHSQSLTGCISFCLKKLSGIAKILAETFGHPYIVCFTGSTGSPGVQLDTLFCLLCSYAKASWYSAVLLFISYFYIFNALIVQGFKFIIVLYAEASVGMFIIGLGVFQKECGINVTLHPYAIDCVVAPGQLFLYKGICHMIVLAGLKRLGVYFDKCAASSFSFAL